jgi:hypothetical protein
MQKIQKQCRRVAAPPSVQSFCPHLSASSVPPPRSAELPLGFTAATRDFGKEKVNKW